MSSGNALGAWNVFASLRSCPASAGSNSACSQQSQQTSFEDAEGKLLRLDRRGWKLRAVYRGQEPLGWVDAMLHLHGFVIVMLQSEDGEADMFLRLDWGNGGLKIQIEESVNEFTTYGSNEKAKEFVVRVVQDAKKPTRTMVETVGWETGVVVVARLAGHAAFKAAVAGSVVGPVGTIVGVVTGIVGTGIVVGSEIYKHQQMDVPQLEFLPAKDDASIDDIIKFLEKVEKYAYDLTWWNCNHFANVLVDTVEKCQAAEDIACTSLLSNAAESDTLGCVAPKSEG